MNVALWFWWSFALTSALCAGLWLFSRNSLPLKIAVLFFCLSLTTGLIAAGQAKEHPLKQGYAEKPLQTYRFKPGEMPPGYSLAAFDYNDASRVTGNPGYIRATMNLEGRCPAMEANYINGNAKLVIQAYPGLTHEEKLVITQDLQKLEAVGHEQPLAILENEHALLFIGFTYQPDREANALKGVHDSILNMKDRLNMRGHFWTSPIPSPQSPNQ